MVSALSRLGRVDPLVWFLAAGLGLFLSLDAVGLGAEDERVIEVDAAKLAAFLARQGGEAGVPDLTRLPPADLRALVRRYVREEALYREALALGLDREDSAIRRRLVQSLEFSLEASGGPRSDKPPSEAELRSLFVAQRERHVENPTISFSHVFFDKRRRGTAAAEAARLARSAVVNGDWLALGDRFPYRREYGAATEDVVAGELGRDAARRLFAMAPDGGRWQGPIESEIGFHLVRIEARTAAREPTFEQVRGDLAKALAEARRREALDKATARIVGEYELRPSGIIEERLK